MPLAADQRTCWRKTHWADRDTQTNTHIYAQCWHMQSRRATVPLSPFCAHKQTPVCSFPLLKMDNQVELNIKPSLVLQCLSDLMKQSPVPLSRCECQCRNLNWTFEERAGLEWETLLRLLNRLLLSQMFYWIRPKTFSEGAVIGLLCDSDPKCKMLGLSN